MTELWIRSGDLDALCEKSELYTRFVEVFKFKPVYKDAVKIEILVVDKQ